MWRQNLFPYWCLSEKTVFTKNDKEFRVLSQGVRKILTSTKIKERTFFTNWFRSKKMLMVKAGYSYKQLTSLLIMRDKHWSQTEWYIVSVDGRKCIHAANCSLKQSRKCSSVFNHLKYLQLTKVISGTHEDQLLIFVKKAFFFSFWFGLTLHMLLSELNLNKVRRTWKKNRRLGILTSYYFET